MINPAEFEKYRDIYICPDPQGHRPTWIWFAFNQGKFYIAASGTQSTWWQSAIKSKTGQVHIAGKIYQVSFKQVSDPIEIKKVAASYLERYHGHSAPDENSNKTILEVIFEQEIGPSDLPKVQV